MTTLTIDIGKTLIVAVDLMRVMDMSEAETTRIPAQGIHALRIGFRNILMDAHAGVKRESYDAGEDGTKAWRDASLGASMKKLDAMYRGEVRANAAGPRAAKLDPVEKAARELARGHIMKLVKGWEKSDDAMLQVVAMGEALGLPTSNESECKSVIAAAIVRQAAKPSVVDEARAQVEREAAIAPVDVSELF
jgi:hypothetical protein